MKMLFFELIDTPLTGEIMKARHISVRQRTSGVHPLNLLSVLFLLALFASMVSMPLLSRAQVSETQPGQAAGEPDQSQVQPRPGAEDLPGLEEKWGIQPVAVRMTARGALVDFRYRILNAEKAKAIVNRQEHPYLLDQASGVKLDVPVSSLGSVRSTGNPIVNRNYFIMFDNSKMIVKSGSKVTVVVGEFKLDMTVQ